MAPQTVAIVSSAYATKPPMPVLVGETCYEGHMQQGFGDVQRRIFWQSILSGAAGHTYGAAGIWHAGVEGDHGNWGAWGRQPYDWTTWKEGMNYPGATQLGLGRKLLEQYPWHKLRAAPGVGAGLLCRRHSRRDTHHLPPEKGHLRLERIYGEQPCARRAVCHLLLRPGHRADALTRAS